MSFSLYRDNSKHYALISIQFSDHFLFIITTVPIIALYVLGITSNSANFVTFIVKDSFSCARFVCV
jgi:hypothetical protein